MISQSEIDMCVIGLGYVGLPLAVTFGQQRSVVGFDIDDKRIDALRRGQDATREVDSNQLLQAKSLSFSSSLTDIESKNFFIVTVPTPIDENYAPDLRPLRNASKMLGGILKPGDIVVYESNVYPGATEEECVPILEEFSGLTFNQDFYIGYSPERINPGDRKYTYQD